MSRFNGTGHQAKPAVATATSPLGTVSRTAPDTLTHNGAPGWARDAKTELFLRASASFNDGGDKFYESGYQRDAKLRDLARQVAVEDFAWFAQFVKWLRRTANVRTSALMVAADGMKARLDAGLTGSTEYVSVGTHELRNLNLGQHSNRSVIDSVLYRADEPGELLAYWTHQYGRNIPKPVKRGTADAVRRLYNQRSLLKYDTASHAFRFGDVLNIVHAAPLNWVDDGTRATGQSELFQYALDRRHNPATAVIPESLKILSRNEFLRETRDLNFWLDPEFLNNAGATWETALSAVGSKVINKAKLWEAMIPSMGYMGVLRNLRNFDESGVSDKVAQTVIQKLADPEEVAKSRQLPFRFYSAFKNVASLRWSQAMETALDLCLPNIPDLPGRTLILTDTSGSMMTPMSQKSTVRCLEAAALFGSALAIKNAGRADLYQYANFTARIPVPKGGSVLRVTEAIAQQSGSVGHGTDIAGAVRTTYSGHDRVIILSDGQGTSGQSSGGVAASVPINVPVYLFNIEGYSASPMPTGSGARFDLGGLSDQTFKLIPLLEAGSGAWPWEIDAQASVH